MLKSKWARIAALGVMALVIPVLAATTRPSAMIHHSAFKPQSKVVHVTKSVKHVTKLHVKKITHHTMSAVRAKSQKLSAVHAKAQKLSTVRVKAHALAHRALHAAK
jgi:hypothetical protein